MIETVEIKNYHGHKHTILEFHKGLNVIKGPSHQGKSSIWRALKWALLNRPLGDAFKSHFAGKESEVSVALEFDDTTLIRYRNKTENAYEAEGVILKAVKSDVPSEVKLITELNEVNLSGQDDPYFLILDSPGSVARKLNEAVGLDIIDETMKKVKSIVSKSNMKLKVIKEEAFKVEGHLESLAWLDDVEPIINQLTNNINKQEKLKRNTLSLRASIIKVRTCENKITKRELWLAIEEPYLEIKSKIEKYNALKREFAQLDVLTTDISQYNDRIAEKQKWLRIEDDYIKLSHKVKARRGGVAQIRHLKQLCKRMQQSEIDVNSANKHLSNLQTIYDLKLKSTGKCPLCGKDW